GQERLDSCELALASDELAAGAHAVLHITSRRRRPLADEPPTRTTIGRRGERCRSTPPAAARLRGGARVAVDRPRRPPGARAPVALHSHAPAARRALDRRGDLDRHRARALDVDPAPAPPGRIPAAVLHAPRPLDPPLR